MFFDLSIVLKMHGALFMEAAAFSSAAQKDCYGELGVERYTWICSFDKDTCGLCGSMDGQVFKLSDYQVGLTAPPGHPWCRCCTAPYFEDMAGLGERWTRDVVTGETFKIPRDMTYEQWKAQQDAKWGEGTVDLQRKMSYNETADRAQFQKYKEALGELAPKSFEEFQQIKYSDPEKWGTIKGQYQILNSYKIDSGYLSPSEILRLDDRVITEKRTMFTSKYKNSGNIAGAYLDGDTEKMFFAHSALSDTAKGYKGSGELVLLKEPRRFQYIDVPKKDGLMRQNTWNDTEAKLFEYFADLYENQPFASITMLSERGMCDSCKGVMAQFKEKYPNVQVNVVSNRTVLGDVWKHRRHRRK